MKGFLFLLSYCAAGLATGSHLELDAYDAILQARGSSRRFQLSRRFLEDNFMLSPSTYLLRRGTGETDWRKSPLTHFEVRPKGGKPGAQVKKDNSNQRVQITGQGPAFISTTTMERQNDQDVAHGETKTIQAHHHAFAMAGGQATGSPPQGAAPQSFSEHPLKASARGGKAVGEVHVPPGGNGYIKTEASNRVNTEHVPGDSYKAKTVLGSGGHDAKVEASVTRGGVAEVVAQVPGPISLSR